jgi:uncharacterized membrane protein required for colicin V production
MEWISQWLDRIFQSMAWRSLFSHFQWLDWLTLISVGMGAIYGIRKGFTAMAGDILQLIAVATLTLELDGKANSVLRNYVNLVPASMVPLIGFIVTAVLAWLLVNFIAKYLRKFLSAQTSTALKIIGGAVGGGFYVFLFLSFISQAVILSPWESLKKVYEKKASYTGYPLARMAPKIHQLITRPFESVGTSTTSP